LQRGWNVFSYEAGEFCYRIPPQHRIGQKWYEGTADAVYHNGEKIHDGAAILGWEPYVFHRVHSPEGSLSTNYAKRLQGFDIDTNFNIYQLDTESGAYDVARLGALDQP